MRVLGIGDNVCDVYLHTNTMYPGGQALNVAVFAQKLGAHAEFLGVFGTDAVAAHVQAVLDTLGVGRPRCRTYAGENGYAKVKLVDGDRVFQGSNRGGVLREHPLILSEDDLAYISGFDIVHTSNNSLIDAELPKLAELPVRVSYDFSGRWDEEDRLERVCPYIDFGFLSCGGALRDKAEEICRHLHQKGCGVVVATMGRHGALLFDGANVLYQPSEALPAVDSLGAGDSYAACVLLASMQGFARQGKAAWEDSARRGEIFADALRKAATFSTEICQLRGAFGHGIPVPPEIAALIYNRREANAP